MPDSDWWDKVREGQPGQQKPKLPPATLDDLIRSHDELRAVLILAGRRIKQQTIGRKDDELVKKMRAVFLEARAISRRFQR